MSAEHFLPEAYGDALLSSRREADPIEGHRREVLAGRNTWDRQVDESSPCKVLRVPSISSHTNSLTFAMPFMLVLVDCFVALITFSEITLFVCVELLINSNLTLWCVL